MHSITTIYLHEKLTIKKIIYVHNILSFIPFSPILFVLLKKSSKVFISSFKKLYCIFSLLISSKHFLVP